MAVKQSRLDLPICDAFLAAAAIGTRSSTTSYDVVEGLPLDTNIGNGRRASTAVPLRRRTAARNLDLLSEAIAARIVIENGRRRRRDHPARRARDGLGERESFSAADGQLATAPVLSGVGPPAHLTSSAYRCTRRPESTKSADHPSIRCVMRARTGDRIQIPEPSRSNRMGLRYALPAVARSPRAIVATGGYMRSDPSLAVSIRLW